MGTWCPRKEEAGWTCKPAPTPTPSASPTWWIRNVPGQECVALGGMSSADQTIHCPLRLLKVLDLVSWLGAGMAADGLNFTTPT
jgi:hypothetical protein